MQTLAQGETIALRLPSQPLCPGNLAMNCLYFSDGSQKTLAAFVTWLALLVAVKLPGVNEDDFQHPCVRGLVGSLLSMRTVLRGSVGVTDELDSAIARIVKQNMDAKVQPVSSVTWASILANLGNNCTLEQAMARYHSHPEVKSLEGDASGAISLDGRKKQASSFHCFESFVRRSKVASLNNHWADECTFI